MTAIFIDDEMKYVVVIKGTGEEVMLTEPCSQNSDDIYHRDIVETNKQSLGTGYKVAGGGRIVINRIAKEIIAFDTSGRFGPARTEVVTRILKKAMKETFNDWQLKVKDTIN